jgi:hypothetical protein
MGLYDVNGKVPVSAWIPSKDDSGNGTTTLNDLVGSNNGTLTNFALTGSTSNWVADTNAGGIRAIDCDITNDFVAVTVASYSDFMLSLWINPTAFGGLPVWFGLGSFWIGLSSSKAAVSISGTTVRFMSMELWEQRLEVLRLRHPREQHILLISQDKGPRLRPKVDLTTFVCLVSVVMLRMFLISTNLVQGVADKTYRQILKQQACSAVCPEQ